LRGRLLFHASRGDASEWGGRSALIHAMIAISSDRGLLARKGDLSRLFILVSRTRIAP